MQVWSAFITYFFHELWHWKLGSHSPKAHVDLSFGMSLRYKFVWNRIIARYSTVEEVVPLAFANSSLLPFRLCFNVITCNIPLSQYLGGKNLKLPFLSIKIRWKNTGNFLSCSQSCIDRHFFPFPNLKCQLLNLLLLLLVTSKQWLKFNIPVTNFWSFLHQLKLMCYNFDRFKLSFYTFWDIRDSFVKVFSVFCVAL